MSQMRNINRSSDNCQSTRVFQRNNCLYSLRNVWSLAVLFAFVACKSTEAPTLSKAAMAPPLPTVTAVLPEDGANVRVISLSSMTWNSNLLSHIEENRMIFKEHSHAQTVYKLYLLNAAYELWRGNAVASDVFLITNEVKPAAIVRVRTPWQLDLRQYEFCTDTNCFIFSTTFVGFSNECTCRREHRVRAQASDWPTLYNRPTIQQEIRKLKFGVPSRR